MTGASHIGGKAEGGETVCPRKKALPSVTQWQEAMGTHWDKSDSLWTWRNTFFYCEGDWSGYPGRSYNLLPWTYSGCRSRQPALEGTAWEGGCTRWPPEVLANLSHSVSSEAFPIETMGESFSHDSAQRSWGGFETEQLCSQGQQQPGAAGRTMGGSSM